MSENAVALFRLSQEEGGAYVIAVDEGGRTGEKLASIYTAQKMRRPTGSGTYRWEPIPMTSAVRARLLRGGFQESQLDSVNYDDSFQEELRDQSFSTVGELKALLDHFDDDAVVEIDKLPAGTESRSLAVIAEPAAGLVTICESTKARS
ncbi:hypothetical protein JH298_21640 (plasmid) [Xanthomonas campestris pv. campestris]|uniref:hypothetical protein n=1 Tax=Xanthomonas campestris TaxID=339 RepID=UPI00279E3964|nr:hypothetical protein JH298_21640 [Xanthomonas campestris pv. campestris]